MKLVRINDTRNGAVWLNPLNVDHVRPMVCHGNEVTRIFMSTRSHASTFDVAEPVEQVLALLTQEAAQ